MKKKTGFLADVFRSGYMRSVIVRVLAILIVAGVCISVAAFYSFTAEINKSMSVDREKRLSALEDAISERMEEIASIAYNIGNDPVFFFDPALDGANSGRNMSEMLARYVVGNNFIEHLAFCRTAEPDRLFTARGERSLSEFFISSFGMRKEEADQMIRAIHAQTVTRIGVTGGGENAYFTYAYPLPQLAAAPKAHVLIMVPVKEVLPLLEALLGNEKGEIAVFDESGTEFFRSGSLEEELDLTAYVNGEATALRSASGDEYVCQKVVSEANGWTYLAVSSSGYVLPGLADKQIAFIAFLLLLLTAAIAAMLVSVIARYKPISNLAAQIAPKTQSGDEIVDEHALLSSAISSLQGDREQKQKYEAAYYEAEAASKAKSAFLSSMSHDIRTPMNAIVGMTAIARKHIGDQTYVDECLRKVQASSEYLLDIINNVLDMSRIESGRLPIAEEPMNLPAVLDSAISLVTPGAEAKNLTLEVDSSAIKQSWVVGDSVHIVQVFVNILSNAVKFTPEGGKITIAARQSETEDAQTGEYAFLFQDTGIGIPPEFIDRVFDTFSRAGDPMSAKTEGTGLGMAIAKKLTELMGGEIRCESTVGKGTTFTVAMPMRYATASETAPNAAPERASATDIDKADFTGKRILLVEDNAVNREIARRIIEETGATVEEAIDGADAVKAFTQRPTGYYDLLFMDIQMPNMNGYEAAEAIRSTGREDAASVPIYAMTANTFDEDVRRVRDAGMNGHIGKPYTPAALYALMARVLGDTSASE